MKLTASEPVAIPIAALWAEVTKFEQFEAGLKKRGVELERYGDYPPGVGTWWTASFKLAGRTLKAEAHVVRMTAPTTLALEGSGTGVDGQVSVVLTELDAARTQLDLAVELKAKSIGAQVILQPLRLAQGKLQGELDERLAHIARSMEARHAARQGAKGGKGAKG